MSFWPRALVNRTSLNLKLTALTALLMISVSGSADTIRMTPDEYRQSLIQARQALRGVLADPPTYLPSSAAQTLDPFTQEIVIVQDDREITTAPLMKRVLMGEVRTAPGEAGQKAALDALWRIEGAYALTQQDSGWAQNADGLASVQQTMIRVLESPEYKLSAIEKFIEDAVTYVLNSLQRLLNRLFGSSVVSSESGFVRFLTAVLIFFVVISLAGIVYVVIKNYRRQVRSSSKTQDVTVEEPTNPEDALERAGKLLETGDCLSALRLIYQAVLLSLDRAGALRLIPGMTNREAVRTLKDPDIRSLLDPSTRLFDDRYYRQQNASREDCEEMISAYTRIVESL